MKTVTVNLDLHRKDTEGRPILKKSHEIMAELAEAEGVDAIDLDNINWATGEVRYAVRGGV